MKRRSFDQSDQIRLKLQWLDEHFGPRRPLFWRMLSGVPLLPVSAAFIIGIMLGRPALSQPFLLGGVGFLSALSIAGLVMAYRSVPTRPGLLFLSTLLLFAAVGMLRQGRFHARGPDHISHVLRTDDRCLATIRGRVVSPVLKHTSQEKFATIPWLDSQSTFYLAADTVRTADGLQATGGRVRVQVSGAVPPVRPGQTVQVYCWLSRFSPPANPGQFDVAGHMALRGVFVSASVSGSDGVEIVRDSTGLLSALRRHCYQFAAGSLLDETVTDTDAAALSSALLLGRRFDLKPQLVAAFRQTNLAHFISLSGMHVAILAGSLWGLLRWLQLPKRPRAVLCIVLILIYALIVPPRAPTMRAVFLSCFFFGSMLIDREVNPLNTLALSAMVLLFARPYELFSAGWQLSFLSVLGIIVLYRPIHYVLLNAVFYPAVYLLRGRFVHFQHVLYRVIELLAVGYSAWIIIAPVLLYYFGQVNPLSPVWTVLTLPVVTVILYAGFLKIVFAAILPTVGSVLGIGLTASAKLLTGLVALLARIDWLCVTTSRPPLVLVLALYGLLAAMCLVSQIHRRWRRRVLVCLIAGFLGPGLFRIAGGFRQDRLTMTCLSVGHGQAIVVSAPGRRHWLFDAGSITHQHLAQKTIEPFLQHHRIFKLDGVWISHGDLDHLNGVPHVAASVPIGHLYANAALIENSGRPSLEKQFGEALAELSLNMEPITPMADGEVTVRSLWPDVEAAADLTMAENDRSEVLLIEYAGRKILLCGDIEASAQQKMRMLYPSLSADVIILPHHGSTTQLETGFVEGFSPSVVIASCGRRNAERAWQPKGHSPIQAFYTALDGAVTVIIKADGTLGPAGLLKSNL